MAGKVDQDIYRYTARRIEDVIIGLSIQYPRYLAFEEEHPNNDARLNDVIRELEQVMADSQDYRNTQEGIHDSYQQIRTDDREKISYIRP